MSLQHRHAILEMIIFPVWLKSNMVERQRLISTIAEMEAKELIAEIEQKIIQSSKMDAP